MMNPKCLGGPLPDTFSAKSAHLTGLKMIRITRAASFDHLVGDRHHSRRNRKAQRLGSLVVDYQFELGRLYHRQICDLCAVENTPDIDAHLKHVLGAHGRVAHQAASSDELTPLVHRGNRMASGERDKLLALDLK